MNLCCEILAALKSRTLSTAESCTGGMIGAALTAIPGSSKVYKGGIISYTNEIKSRMLDVPAELLSREGAVSGLVAQEMARGARKALGTDFAVSVTGLAGPGGDEFGNPVGTVYIGYADSECVDSCEYHFNGSREEVRLQAAKAALNLLYARLVNGKD